MFLSKNKPNCFKSDYPNPLAFRFSISWKDYL